MQKLGRIHNAHYNEQRLEVLQEQGLNIAVVEDKVSLSHKTYMQMMYGLIYLSKAPESKYKWMNYLRLDYKNAYTGSPSVDDIIKTLPESSGKIVKALEENMQGIKVKAKVKPLRGIVSDFKWKVEYSYKSKNICGFYADYDYFMLCLYFNNFQNINKFADVLISEDMEMFEWFKKQFKERLCKCPSNRMVRLGDEKRRICGLSNRTETEMPSGDDVKMAINVLRKYRGID